MAIALIHCRQPCSQLPPATSAARWIFLGRKTSIDSLFLFFFFFFHRPAVLTFDRDRQIVDLDFAYNVKGQATFGNLGLRGPREREYRAPESNKCPMIQQNAGEREHVIDIYTCIHIHDPLTNDILRPIHAFTERAVYIPTRPLNSKQRVSRSQLYTLLRFGHRKHAARNGFVDRFFLFS